MTLRRGLYWPLLALVSVGTGFLALTWLGNRNAQTLLDLLIGLLALGFLLRARPQQTATGCQHCGSIEDPVRSVGGRRLWACRQCGAERPRRRSRQEIERGTV